MRSEGKQTQNNLCVLESTRGRGGEGREGRKDEEGSEEEGGGRESPNS